MQLVKINRNPSRHDLRMFAGVWFPLFCAALGAAVWRKTGSLQAAGIVWGVGAAIALVCLLSLRLARLLALGMSYATFPIGFVVSHLIVAVVYFLVVTPVGFILRLCGHDALRLRFDRAAASYWIAREEPAGPESYFHEY